MKRFLIVISILFVVGAVSLNRPVIHVIEKAAIALWQQLSYPFEYARLVAQEPDTALLVPVEDIRVSQIADTWGAPRSGGRTHQGQDIFAPRGSPVISATDGFITRVADSGLGGKHVFVTGAGGYRYYYAHLDDFADISTGQKVVKGTVLGVVGDTGNAKGTPPHLHFGMYTSSGAQNPLALFVDSNF